MNTTSYMDKQIMDLSQGSSPQTKDFIDLMSHQHHLHHHRREDDDEEEDQTTLHGGPTNGNIAAKNDAILASYDFQPIRPVTGIGAVSSSLSQSSNFDLGGSARPWSSGDSKTKSVSPVRNYGSLDSIEPAKFVLEKDKNAFDSAMIDEIDKTMKKHTDNLLHSLDGVSARLTQLETRTRNLENSVDDLKVSAGNNHGSTDGKMRQLENILREVQSGVQVLKDKQDIVEAQLHLAKLQVSKVDHHQETHNMAPPVDSVQTSASAPQQIHQQLPPPVNLPPAHAPFSSPNAPPQPPPQQNMPPPVQLSNQFPQTPIPPPPTLPRDPYFPPPAQTQEAPNQPYQMPSNQQQLPLPTMPPPSQQYQPPPPPPQFPQPPPPQPPHQHLSLSPPNPPQLPPPLGHHSEEPPYVSSQPYPPPSLRQQPPSQPPSGPPPPQPFYGAPAPNVYEPPSSRPNPGFPSTHGQPPGINEPYHYGGSPAHYGNASGLKPQQLSLPTHSGGTTYPQLPTARVLPHAAPAASTGGGGGSGSSGSGNRVPVDDVIDKVATMGFPRDHVRATVRRLTENGQSVDLNIVLDKLMNEGDGQPPRGWFGR